MAEAICIQLKQGASNPSASQSAATTKISIPQLLDILDTLKTASVNGVKMARKLSDAIQSIASNARDASETAKKSADAGDFQAADKSAKEASRGVKRAEPIVNNLKRILAEAEKAQGLLTRQIGMLGVHRLSASGQPKANLTGAIKRAEDLQEYLGGVIEDVSAYVRESDSVARYAEEAKQHAQSAHKSSTPASSGRDKEEAPTELTFREIKEYQKWAEEGLDTFEGIRKRASSTRSATEELMEELGEALDSKASVDTAQRLAERISACLEALQEIAEMLRTTEQEAEKRAAVLDKNTNPTGKHTPADDALSDTQDLAESSGQLAEKIENYLKTRKPKLAKLEKRVQKTPAKAAKRA